MTERDDVDAVLALGELAVADALHWKRTTVPELKANARAAGLEYRHLPVNGAYQSPEEIAARADLELEQAQKVVEILKAEFEE